MVLNMNTVIIGTGMTKFSKQPLVGLRDLVTEAVRECLADSGVTAAEVQMAVFGNAAEGVVHGQEMIRGEVALRYAGLRGVPILNVENACASSSTALNVACMAVESGSADVVLVVGAEHLSHPRKARSFAAIATSTDLDEDGSLGAAVTAELLGGLPSSSGLDRSPTMDRYADKARAYMERWGVTSRDLANVSVKNRRHASMNPLAQFQTPVSVEEVELSRLIVDPLRLLMCAPVGDGAAALLVCSEDFANKRRMPGARVLASKLTSNSAHPDARDLVRRAADAAYTAAGVSPSDIDVAEVHDACSAAELWLYEELGFCDSGAAVAMVERGDATLGGSTPVNTSGGLLGRGHPLGATGCAQVVELVDQLRGRAGMRQVDGARIALAQNAGGILDDGNEAVACVTILEKW